jgi:hypothetical protein
VDAFHRSLLGAIVMPTANIVFIGAGLLCNTFIENGNAFFTCDYANVGLDDPPQVR